MCRVLIIDEDHGLAEWIGRNLRREGLEVMHARDGLEGTALALRELPDLILVDLELPGRDGLAVIRELKGDPGGERIPVLILTARGQPEDRIQGLEAGADDYLTKPFNPRELVLRVQAILKRRQAPAGTKELVHGPFRFDRNIFRFYLDGERVWLTATEFKLLFFLCEHPGNPVDRASLLRTIWGRGDASQSRTLDTHIKRLRQKLGSHGAWLQTVRGDGYRVAKPGA
jgi:two-component system phosphate regulon response regulator PhoB